MISIEIPVTWGSHLEEVLEVIRSQEYEDYEIVCSLSTVDSSVIDILKKFDVKYNWGNQNILSKRYYANLISKGDGILLLDETRIPSRNLLQQLSTNESDMAVIPELDYGNGWLVRIANADKIFASEKAKSNPNLVLNGFVMPRYFKRWIINKTFEMIRSKISQEIFDSILMEDHQIITYEAFHLSSNISVLDGAHIYHYGDESLVTLVKKYYKYGRMNAVLVGTEYENITKMKNRLRPLNGSNIMNSMILQLLRGVPFILGRLSSDNEQKQ